MLRDLSIFLAVFFGVWIIVHELGAKGPGPLPLEDAQFQDAGDRPPYLTQTQISGGLFGNPSGLQTEL